MAVGDKTTVVPQKVIFAYLTTTEEQVEKHSISSEQEGYNPHPAMDAYSSSY